MRYVLLITLLLASACARPPATPAPAQQATAPEPQKPLVIAIGNEPRVLEPSLTSGVNNRDYTALTSGFLAYLTPRQEPLPYLAEELPTVEKGTWKVHPDGRMETTYRLKSRAAWHDGTPVTAADWVFAHRVRNDPAIGVEFAALERRMGEVRALDDMTLFIDWKEAFIWAGMVHAPYFAPMARHVLEPVYETDKDAFVNSPLLRDQFVGSGPYRLERWEPGAQMQFRAQEGFVLGRPSIEHITVRFIPDGNTIVANLLSGAVDVSFYSSLGFPQNEALEQASWEGTAAYWRGIVRFIEFQMRDWGNHQPLVLDVRVRRALLHALDRQAIVDGLFMGKTVGLHFWMSPDDPFYPAIDRAVTKYEYDPPRAEVLLREAGWAKGADGVARNAAGESLQIPLLNQFGTLELQEGNVLLNNWKAVGVTSDMTQLTAAQDRDGEMRSKFPAVSWNRRGIGYDSMVWVAANVSRPDNRWQGQNRIGYVNTVLEGNWLKALATVDAREREGLFIEALKAMTADAVVTPTHLQPRTLAYRRGLVGPTETWVGENAIVWNIWQWRWTS